MPILAGFFKRFFSFYGKFLYQDFRSLEGFKQYVRRHANNFFHQVGLRRWYGAFFFCFHWFLCLKSFVCNSILLYLKLQAKPLWISALDRLPWLWYVSKDELKDLSDNYRIF